MNNKDKEVAKAIARLRRDLGSGEKVRKEEKNIKKAFVRDWELASPKEQAEILWSLFLLIKQGENHTHTELMRF